MRPLSVEEELPCLSGSASSASTRTDGRSSEATEPISLEPKAYELLCLFLSRRPKALSKAQIRDVLWPGSSSPTPRSPGPSPTCVRPWATTRVAPDSSARSTASATRSAARSNTTAPPPLPLSSGCGLLWAGREIPLPEGEHLLGRDGECLVRSRSVRVSRRHAKITVTGSRAVLEDLGSRNGTSVSGRRIEGPVELAGGDTIGVGPEEIVFLGGSDGSTVTDGR